jgi:hypothetical protein
VLLGPNVILRCVLSFMHSSANGLASTSLFCLTHSTTHAPVTIVTSLFPEPAVNALIRCLYF